MDDVLTRHTRCLRLSLPVFLSSVSVLSASLAATSRQQMAVASASLRSAVFAYAAPSSSSSSSSARSLLFPSGGAVVHQLIHRNLCSAFYGQALLPVCQWPSSQRNGGNSRRRAPSSVVMMVKPTIQFIQGTDEQTIPDVRLTKSRDGTNGMAIFRFEQPSVFDSSGDVGEITGFYMIDEEGVLQSVDVSAKFVNGKPAGVEAKYVMRTPKDWDRFMRFMERYSNENGLQFIKK
ncbi:hypothetical protein MLD38_020239 [Melastoma candidum]|uniref:Uncharacterized protein n=1 Tax=Melastoma candidum TaxID=119954 RepID=A0ACB9QFA6_9MYRT|nr:hypothetical protein MLD38_020239 [Melastoma candidum]